MKRIYYILLVVIFASTNLFSQELKHIKISKKNDAEAFIANSEYDVHYQSESFIVATTKNSIGEVIDHLPWQKGYEYFIVWNDEKTPQEYFLDINKFSETLFRTKNYQIIKVANDASKNLFPAVHGGIVKLNNRPIKQANKNNLQDIVKDVIFNQTIADYVAEIEIDSVTSDIVSLQNFVTRNCYEPQSVDAQNWIKSELERYNLDVSLQDFPMSSGNSSDNVIAVQTGLVNPNKYVVIGGHYDSYSSPQTNAPGADDNASGTSGVIEVARILSQYEFSYSIVYCAFSGEEYGLYGSQAYASEAAGNGMDILGYLNLDMIGYLHPGDNFHTDMMCPPSAQPLADYYEEIVNTYVSDFTVEPGTLIGGDSDHTSFNNNGYMGIFPFEDGNNYSPYIHSTQDTYGLSVNSDELVEKFVQAAVAFVADFAMPFNGLYPPTNLIATQNDNQVDLTWDQPQVADDFIQYNIYRNNEVISTISDLSNTNYTDYSIVTGNEYIYYITAEYGGSNSGESYPSNTATIEFGLMEICFFDFEDGVQGWTINGTSNGWMYAQVNLSGNNTEYISIDSDVVGSGTHVFDYAISPELDLSSFNTMKLDFDYGFKDISTDFFKVLYRENPSADWVELESLSASNSFTNKVIPLPEQAQTTNCQIAMYYDDNNTWAWYAGFDNVKITGYEGGTILPAPQELTYEVVDEAVVLNWASPSKSLTHYNIYKDGALQATIDASNSSYTDTDVSAGNTYIFYITAVYSEGESAPSNQVTVDIVGMQENTIGNISIYPNPAKDKLQIEFNSLQLNQTSIYVLDLYGRVLKQIKVKNGTGTVSLNTSEFRNGTYNLQIRNSTEVKTYKFAVIK